MKSQSVLLSTAYFPPVQYISKFLLYKSIFIEKHENYNKQSYRNRCIILGANGPQNLIIPVQKDAHPRIPISEVKIDYDTNWTKMHWKAIEAAYRRSPFYEYYIDDFARYYKLKFESLLEFNTEILNLILLRIGINSAYSFTENYTEISSETDDFRNSIHPKLSKSTTDEHFRPSVYNQVFSEKYNFTENLSILDLLFNEGPNSLSVIKKSAG